MEYQNILMRLKMLLFISVFFYSNQTIGQTVFAPENIIFQGKRIGDIIGAKAADMDNDGDVDIIVASSDENTIGWLENEGAPYVFEYFHLISNQVTEIADFQIGDFDADGDVDVLTANLGDNQVVWFENQNGTGSFWNEVVVASTIDQPNVLFMEDLDADGDLDALVASKSENQISWFENQNGAGNFIFKSTLNSDLASISDIFTADLDGDNDQDVLVAASDDDKVVWFKNEDGQGNFGEQILIIADFNFAKAVSAADIDGDGDLDVVAGSGGGFSGKVSWFENLDGNGNFGEIMEISEFNHLNSICQKDIDEDGDLDLLVSAKFSPKTSWFENLDGLGNFGEEQVIFTSLNSWHMSAVLADINNDNHLDVLLASRSHIRWFENKMGDGSFGFNHNVPLNPNHLISKDFDNDGDLDLMGISENKILWYKNENEGVNFQSPKVMFHYENRLRRIEFLDFDGDGNENLATINNEDEILLLKYDDGLQKYEIEKIIDPPYKCSIVKAGDIDGDSDEDILAFYGDWQTNNFVVWYENEDGLGNYGEPTIIHGFAYQTYGLELTDLDGDGDLDILYGSDPGNPNNTSVGWFENEDGQGNFSFFYPISSAPNILRDARAVDIDQDGDQDVMTLAYSGALFAWFENEDGLANFGSAQIFQNDTGIPMSSVEFADIDNDEDLDALFSNYGYDIGWYENLDGEGQFGNGNIISNNESTAKIFPFDVDNDGAIDLLSYDGIQNYSISWYKNLLLNPKITGYCYYDANQNKIKDIDEVGLFNQSLIVEPEEITTFTNPDGAYQIYVENGLHTISINPSNNWSLTTDSSSYTIDFQGLAIQNINFGLFPETEILKVESNLSSTATRCGFQVPFWLTLENTGTTFADGYLALEIDPLTTFINATPEPDSIENNFYFWAFENLPPSYSENISVLLQMPGVQSLGEQVAFYTTTFVQDSTGMIEECQNYKYISTINCSYDPNDKMSNPPGEFDQNFTLFGESLEYTVRFQNTGTDTAFTVRIEDQLDEDLDWNTFHPIAASHPYSLTLRNEGLVEFLFENILLPDSTTNEPASHGFVKYQIEPKENLEENAEIQNTASIFFDFNPPIFTNTTLNTLVSEITDSEEIIETFKLQLSPNPFGDWITVSIQNFSNLNAPSFKIFDVNGTLVKKVNRIVNSSFQLNCEDWVDGIYFYQLESEGIKVVQGKIIKQ